MFLVRRLAVRNNSINGHLRCYCAPSSSSSSSTSNKLFVGGLSWAVDEKSLKEAFSSFGDVSEVRIMYDKDSGRSRGFGFVHFSKDDDAKSAREAMDGKAFLGRPLRISYALEKARGGPVVVPRLSNIGDLISQPAFAVGNPLVFSSTQIMKEEEDTVVTAPPVPTSLSHSPTVIQ